MGNFIFCAVASAKSDLFIHLLSLAETKTFKINILSLLKVVWSEAFPLYSLMLLLYVLFNSFMTEVPII